MGEPFAFRDPRVPGIDVPAGIGRVGQLREPGTHRRARPRRVEEGSFADLVGTLYGIADTPARWADWLVRLCGAVEADVCVLAAESSPGGEDRGSVLVDVRGAGDAPCPVPLPVAPAHHLIRLAEEDAVASEPFLLPGEPRVLSEVPTRVHLTATRLYREWLRPRDLHHVACMVVSRSAECVMALALLRRREARRFGPAALDLLRRLHPHVVRAADLQERLRAAALREGAADAVLGSLRWAPVVLDGEGRVCSVNGRAAALLARGDGLALRDGRLRATQLRDRALLATLVEGALGGEGGGGWVAVSRAAPHRRLALFVSGVPASVAGSSVRSAGALVLACDPEDLPELSEPALCRLYGVTQAETRVAALVARGRRLKEIAACLGVSHATVRTQLQQVLAKTGTHRQADLVRVLLTGFAPGSPSQARVRGIGPVASPR